MNKKLKNIAVIKNNQHFETPINIIINIPLINIRFYYSNSVSVQRIFTTRLTSSPT